MTISPILRAKLKKYIQDYELRDMTEDEAFERFVNFNILSQLYPGIFTTETDLLDLISVGGSNDLGLDGIAFSLNGRLIRTKEDIDDNLAVQKKGKFEITFIQSKNKEKYDLGEYMKFTGGVLDFLNEEIQSPCNEEIKAWHDIYIYMLSDDIITKWESGPAINIIYCSLGEWDSNPHICGQKNNVEKIIEGKGLFESIDFRFVDGKALMDIINSNDSCYSSVINVLDSIQLPPVDKVDNSSIIMCQVNELLKLLTYENVLRRNIFTDNVRDYQGDTTINQEIGKTLIESSQEFVLLNNGITIVCDEMREVNRKITIKNPQVVNGCQTCNVLYNVWKQKKDVLNAYVIVKVIASSDSSIVSNIIKGTNRQNIVYDEAFEVTRDFHKYLEDFYKIQQIDGFDKIFYERRSKQFDGDDSVKLSQKVNFRLLIQSFVSLFLYKVEQGHRHESRLLQDFKKDIFDENQSFSPYYLAGFIGLKIETMFKRKELSKEFYTYKYHIMLILKEMLGGESPSINKKKEIEKYCDKLQTRLISDSNLIELAKKACENFKEITEKYVSECGESAKYHIKDSNAFTTYMLKQLRSAESVNIDKSGEKELNGRVLNFSTDRSGCYFGFISKEPNNIFFHESDNPKLNISLIGKIVRYEIEQRRGKEYAVNIGIIDGE